MDVAAIVANYRDIIANHYFDMRGRVSRSRFWWFVLANVIASILAQIVGGVVHLPLGEVYNLAVLLPAMSLGARRLQDIGREGKLVWLLLILTAATQLIGIMMALTFIFHGFIAFLLAPGLTLAGLATLVILVILIWFWCQPGDPAPNAYGPVPPGFDPMRPVTPSP